MPMHAFGCLTPSTGACRPPARPDYLHTSPLLPTQIRFPSPRARTRGPAEDEDKIMKHRESDLNELEPFLNDLTDKDEMEPSDVVAISDAEEELYSNTLFSERDQSLEKPWFFPFTSILFSHIWG